MEESKLEVCAQAEDIVVDIVQDAEKRSIAGNCYCGKERNLNIVELLCATCNHWFHESCIGYQLGKSMPFITSYIFVCKNCSPSGLESFRKVQATIPQMCVTAIANLQQNASKEGRIQTFFGKDDIISFIDHYWESMTTLPRRSTQTWHCTIQRNLSNNANLFVSEENIEMGTLYGLVDELVNLKPNYENMAKSGQLRITEDGYTQASVPKTNRQHKRKFPSGDTGSTGKKGRPNSDVSTMKLPAHGYPLEHPFNKDGYRYILAEPDPLAPFRQEFDESSDWAGKPIPGWLYRALVPNSILLALHDCAPQMKISEDRLSVMGDKGYCMVRATHSVNRGTWYFEATVEEMPEGSASRIGWGQEYANLQAPLGYDKFGYGWRSRKGTCFHESHGKHYSDGYGEGDTLGFLITLPQIQEWNYVPNTFKDKPLVKFKSHLYYEDKDKVSDTLKSLKHLTDSRIEFFKNGVSEGVAFRDIYAGAYYPAVSIHRNANISMNFGPNFKYAELFSELDAKSLHDRVEEVLVEQSLADLQWLTVQGGNLRLDNI